MGRATEGVRGIGLRDEDVVVGMVVVHDDATLLVVSEYGMGKRTLVDAYRMQKRGGKGVINLKTSDKTGQVISIKAVAPEEQLMLITRKGVVNRQHVEEIRVIGRATQGVRLMNLDEGDVVVDVARVVIEDDEDLDGEGAEGAEVIDESAEGAADAQADAEAGGEDESDSGEGGEDA